jgi:hypothetical protein
MTDFEKAKRAVELINHAMNTLKECAAEERKMYHDKHTDQYYREALDRLDVKRTGAEAYLFRLEILGE